jgi:hypothetical protein
VIDRAKMRARWKRYNISPKGRARDARFQRTAKGRTRNKRYEQTDKAKARAFRYNHSKGGEIIRAMWERLYRRRIDADKGDCLR